MWLFFGSFYVIFKGVVLIYVRKEDDYYIDYYYYYDMGVVCGV